MGQDPEDSRIAAWVRAQRAASKFTQAHLGAQVGKSRTWVASLESGVFRPRVEDCALLASVFTTPVEDVLALADYADDELAALGRAHPGDRRVELSLSDLEMLARRAAELAVAQYVANPGISPPKGPNGAGHHGAPRSAASRPGTRPEGRR